MEKEGMKELQELMDKIIETKALSDVKNSEIENKEKDLREELKPIVVEEKKEEIKKLKDDKKEFDEMTVNALIETKIKIKQELKKLEEEHQNKLLEALERKNDIKNKLENMRKRNSAPENADTLAQAENAAQKAQTELDKEMSKYENEYLENTKKLNLWNTEITEFAIELDSLEKVEEEAEKGMKDPQQQDPQQQDPQQQDPQQQDPQQQDPQQQDPQQQDPQQQAPQQQAPQQQAPQQQAPQQQVPQQQAPQQQAPQQQAPQQQAPQQQAPQQQAPQQQAPQQQAPQQQAPQQQAPQQQAPQQRGPQQQNPQQQSQNEPIITEILTEEEKKLIKDNYYEIKIGNKGTMWKNGQKIAVDKKLYKQGAKLNVLFKEGKIDELVDLLEKQGYSEKLQYLIADALDLKVPIDLTVINSVKGAKMSFMPQEEKEAVIKQYISNAIRAHYDYYDKTGIDPEMTKKLSKYKDIKYAIMPKPIKDENGQTVLDDDGQAILEGVGIDITYDMKDLSKIPFFKGKALTGKEKESIAERARAASQYGIALPEGQYSDKPPKSIIGRFIHWITRRGDVKPLLPAPDKMEIVDHTDKDTKYATISDKDRDEAKKVSEVLDTLREEAKDNDTNFKDYIRVEAENLKNSKGEFETSENEMLYNNLKVISHDSETKDTSEKDPDER